MNGISVGRKVAIGACVAALGAGAALVGVAGSATAPSITLKSRTAGSLGKVLAAPNAHTLYRLSPETKTHVLCASSTCLGIWKPLHGQVEDDDGAPAHGRHGNRRVPQARDHATR